MLIVPQKLLPILEAFSGAQVRCVLIGGAAMRLRGSAHIIDDLDFCYDRAWNNLERLVSALAAHHPTLRGAPPDLPFVVDARTLKAGLNFTLQTMPGLLGEAAGIASFEGVWERATAMDIHQIPVRVASLDDLIAMKRAAGRPKDLTHLRELEALRVLTQQEESTA